MDDLLPIDILVIEDDADTRVNLRDILELDDHRVVTAANAAEALNRENWDHFAAIILDRRLPDATAEQLLPRLKAVAPHAAVIVVTGYADIQGAIAALRQGASDYILKPLNPDVLRASLTRIAERQRLRLAKEASEAAFRHLVEAAECLIVILRPDHSIVYFSPFAERLTGYTAAEVRRARLPDAVPARGPTAGAVAGDVPAGRSPARLPHGFENPVVCRDGTRRWITWNARHLPDYEGGSAVLKIGQDITYLKQAQERAMQAERLAAIGQMVAGLAHESRNALQRSQACLEMLALAVRDRPDALALIDRLQKAQDHLHLLYEDVRGYAAPIVLDRRPCDLGVVWREAWAHLAPARKAKDATLRATTRGVDLYLCAADAFRSSARSSTTSSTTRWPPAGPPSRSISTPRARSSRASPRSECSSATTDRDLTCSRDRKSSTRSSPPRPRGPAWDWPSPGGSSRPTAARSPLVTATMQATLPARCSSSLYPEGAHDTFAQDRRR